MARGACTLEELLGSPAGSEADGAAIQAVARDWGVVFPPDYVAVAATYGDMLISGYLYFCGAVDLRAYGERWSRQLAGSPAVPQPVPPAPDGLLQWGHTIEGDLLSLGQGLGGDWTVSAFRRGWADWHETGLGFGEWSRGPLAGTLATDWLPEWELGPHPIERRETPWSGARPLAASELNSGVSPRRSRGLSGRGTENAPGQLLLRRGDGPTAKRPDWTPTERAA